MTLLRTAWSTYIDRQHCNPTGLVGYVIGERMLRQHAPETTWSVDLLGLQHTDTMLELGCGAGRGLALACQQATHGHVIGVDRSARMLQSAARRNRASVLRKQLALVRGDIANLPFGPAHFDKILSIHTFYFWVNPHAVCAELVALLASGGRLVSTFATARTLPDGQRSYWPLQHQAEALVHTLQQHPNITATLATGPDSRQFNTIALVIDKK